MPIDKIPLKEANEFLNRYKNFLRQFELGARQDGGMELYHRPGKCDRCLASRRPDDAGYVPMMVLKVRVTLAEGDYAAAATGCRPVSPIAGTSATALSSSIAWSA